MTFLPFRALTIFVFGTVAIAAAQVPTVTSVAPGSGVIGASVLITGTNFDTTPANNIVLFNGTPAVISSCTATSINTLVPNGATTGTITVTVNGQTGTSALNFYIVQSQVIMTAGSVQVCNAQFLDPQGFSDYIASEDVIETFSPVNPAEKVRISFLSFSTESGYDILYVYNGPTTASPLLATLSGATLPMDITAYGPGGELTLKFHSDGSVQRPGWEAIMSCQPAQPPPATLNWADWISGQSGPAGSATGVFNTADGPVNISYTGEIAFIETGTGTDYYTPSTPYIGPQISNAPPAAEMIALSKASVKTLNFSRAVDNLYFAVVSLNGNGYKFNRNFDIISYGPGYWGNGVLTKKDLGGGQFELDGTGEGHGVIRFIGSVTSITWTSLTDEYWNGFTLGTLGIAQGPTITSFTPDSGVPGTQVTLVGMNFDLNPLNNIVKFNGVQAAVTFCNGTSIVTTVPAGATTGLISVTVGNNSGTGTTPFTLLTSSTLAINMQPTSISACDGTSASFTISASGTGPLTYQWQKFDGSIFNSLANIGGYSGIDSPTLSVNTAGNFGTGDYHCMITGSTTNIVSNSVALTVKPLPTSTIIASNFSTDAEGWTIQGDAQGSSVIPTYFPSGGNPGGFIQAVDNQSGGTWYWNVPSKFLITGLAGTTLTFDMKITTISSYFSERDIIVSGSGLTLHADFFNQTDLSTTWKSYTFVFDKTLPWYKGSYTNRTLATAAEIQSVFQNVTQISFRGEFNSGADTGGLDNVGLTGSAQLTATNGQGCPSTAVTLQVSGASGSQGYRWYDLSAGGSPLDSTASFTTPIISSTTTYYAALYSSGCESARVPVIATILNSPAAPTTQPGSACGPLASILITASGASNGLYRWYTTATGGTSIPGEQNNSYGTPPLTVSTVYYVAITDGICESTRVPVEAEVITPPSPPTTTNGSGVAPNSIVLLASGATNGDYRWYTDSTGNTLITGAVDSVYVTPVLTTSTSYYVSIDDGTCQSVPAIVIAEILPADISVYNALSPNGDGKNEIFYIENIGAPHTRNNKVTIYNRWGDVVYETQNYDNASRVFHGENKNGDALPAGTYYYKIDFANGSNSKTGFISLRR